MLRDTKIRVLEIAPPWIRTQSMNSLEAEQAMPLNQFVAEAIKTLGIDANEIIVDAAKRMQENASPGEHTFVNAFNTPMLALFGERPAVAAE